MSRRKTRTLKQNEAGLMAISYMTVLYTNLKHQTYRVCCAFELYTIMEHLMSSVLSRAFERVFVARKYKWRAKWDINLWYTTQKRCMYNYFIPCQRKCSGQHNQCDIRGTHNGKVGCNSIEYPTDFPYSHWRAVFSMAWCKKDIQAFQFLKYKLEVTDWKLSMNPWILNFRGPRLAFE